MTPSILNVSGSRYPTRMRERLGNDVPTQVFALGNLNLIALPKITLSCFARSPGDTMLDKVNQVLAQHFGFRAEELNFIINCGIKDRMGRDTENEDET